MELKDRKYIKNTSLLPKHAADPNNKSLFLKIDNWGGQANKAFGTNYGAVGSGITSGIQFYGDLDNAFSYNRSVDDLQADAGLSQLSVGGISYRYQNDVNRSREMERVGNENKANTLKSMGSGAATGAAIGSLFPGAGTLIGGAVGAVAGLVGGLFGGGARKREAERRIRIANQTAYNMNDFHRSGALSTAMQQDYTKQYGDTRQQSLYGAADGKEEGVDPITNETYDNFVVETADGKKVDKQNSWVEKGEWIWNPITQALNYVDHGPNDGARANLKPEDVVFTRKHNIAKNVPKFAAEGRLEELANILAMAMKDKNDDNMKLYKAKCGKLPKHAGGVSVLPNLIANGLTTLGGLYQYLDAKNQDIKKPNSYVENPYETRALNDLYSLRVNPYPIMPELYNEYNKAMTSVNRSGGLSGGQRTLARLSAMNNLQRNTAQMLLNAQERNNQYRAAAAQAAMAAGSESAKRRAAANQYDLEYYSRAHAAKKQGEQQAMYNMLNGIQSFLANNQNMSMFNNMYGLYASEQERKNAETQAIINNMTRGNSTPADTGTWRLNLTRSYGPIDKDVSFELPRYESKLITSKSPLYNYPIPQLTLPLDNLLKTSKTSTKSSTKKSAPQVMMVSNPYGSPLRNTLVQDAATRATGRQEYENALDQAILYSNPFMKDWGRYGLYYSK